MKKWIVPRYMYNGNRYPDYVSGAGYVLSAKAAECIYSNAKRIPYFHLEDIFVTGFVAQSCGAKILHNTGFHVYRDRREYILNQNKNWVIFKKEKDILLHYPEQDVQDKFNKKFSKMLDN